MSWKAILQHFEHWPWSRWQDFNVQNSRIRKFSLRFIDPGIEKGFLKKHSSNLDENINQVLPIFLLTILFLSITPVYEMQSSWVPELQQVHRRWQVYILVYLLVMPPLFVLLLRCKWIPVSDLGREAGICMLSVLTCFPALFLEDYYLLKVRGINIPYAMDTFTYPVQGSDSRVLLFLFGVCSAMHMVLPIRWCVVIVVELFTIGAYCFLCLGVGTNEFPWRLNLLFLSCLVASSALMKRSRERLEREEYSNWLNEKLLRFETEAKLEHTLQDGAAMEPTSESSTSSMVFGTGLMTAPELSNKLERIALVGRKEQWLVDHSHLRLSDNRILGLGGFGIVVAGRFLETQVAVKLPRRNNLDCVGNTGKEVVQLGNELRILRRVRHPNIVLFYGAYVDPVGRDLALVLEMVEGQLLSEYVAAPRCNEARGKAVLSIDQEEQRPLLFGICLALRYLHALDPCIIHGDLKPSNIVVESSNSQPRPKLLDFGLSRIFGGAPRRSGGTTYWMAPEIVLDGNRQVDRCTDVFSLGCTLYFILTGRIGMGGLSRPHIINLAKNKQPLRLCWPHLSCFEDQCMPIVSACVHSAESRPSMEDVCTQILADPNYSTDRELPASAQLINQIRLKSSELTADATSTGRASKIESVSAVIARERKSIVPVQSLALGLQRIDMDIDLASPVFDILNYQIHFQGGGRSPEAKLYMKLPASLADCMRADDFQSVRRKLLDYSCILDSEADVEAIAIAETFVIPYLLRDTTGKHWPVVSKFLRLSVPAGDADDDDPTRYITHVSLSDLSFSMKGSRRPSLEMPSIQEAPHFLSL